jgi:hypothetical protein
MAYYSNVQDAMSNMAFGPYGALGQVAMGVAAGEPTAFGQNFSTVQPGFMYNHSSPYVGVSTPAYSGDSGYDSAEAGYGVDFGDGDDATDIGGFDGFGW